MSTSDRVQVELKYPIDHDGKTLKSISMRRPTVGDTLGVQKGATGAPEIELRLVALLTGLPMDVIAKLDMKDYTQVQQVMREMLT